ncbi:MAG: hypothetical protein K2X86_05870 [Cytophagaceae bacterium]|nr:hypothetical protein [Cytophagaceae bacterium]
MKKLFVVLSLVVATSFTAFAQRPVAGAKGFTFGVTGINNIGVGGAANTGLGLSRSTLLFRYYVADGLAVRVGLGYENDKSTIVNDQTKFNGTKTTIKNTGGGDFAITLGAQKSLGEGEKLEPYVGADLLIGMGGNGATTENTTEVTDATLAGGTNGDFTTVKNTVEKTMSIGILPTVGFNYFFAENFAIGAEFNWGFVMSNTKTGEQTTTTKTGGTTTTTTTPTGFDTKGSEFGSFGSGLLTVSVFF